MGIEWGKRKLSVSHDEENSGTGFTLYFPPLIFSFWTKKHSVDFVEEAIYTEDLDVQEELELLRGIDPDSGIPYLPWSDGSYD